MWHQVRIAVPDELTAVGSHGEPPNTATLVIELPASLNGTLTVDNLRVIEWRGPVAVARPLWVDADFVRSTSAYPVDLVTSGC